MVDHATPDRLRRWYGAVAALCCALTVAGCSLAPVRIVNTLRGRWVDRVSIGQYPDRLSPGSVAALAAAGFSRPDWADAEAAIRKVVSHRAWRTSAAISLAEAELAMRAAMETPRRKQELATALLFLSAEAAYAGLHMKPATEDLEGRLVATYNEAVMRATLAWYRHRPAAVSAFGRTWKPVLRVSAGEFFPGMSFDRLEAAAGLEQRGLWNRYTVDGIGAAFVASRANQGVTELEAYLPSEGIFYPATAILRFAGGRRSGGTATLEILDPDRTPSIRFAGRTRMLSADFTMPQAALLSRSGDLRLLEIREALRPGSGRRRAGLYLMQPYDPNRIPLVMIHGLLASPLTWRQVTNELRGNPEIRKRYQIWHFYYPTGLSPLTTAAWLRRDIDDLQRILDPGRDDFASRHMVVIAHSMGGLLAHTLVSDSGLAIWRGVLRVNPEEIRASPEAVRSLENALVFRRKPFVQRVIFIAVPHRGSDLATGFLARLARRIISIPESVIRTQMELLTGNPGLWTDSALKVFSGRYPSSVDSLRPDSPGIRELDALPIAVPVHSIIGQRKPGPKETGTDGIVPWTSSHHPQAVSELVIQPANHHVHNHPAAIAEIRRILSLPAPAGRKRK